MLNSEIHLGDARAVIEIDFRPAGSSGIFRNYALLRQFELSQLDLKDRSAAIAPNFERQRRCDGTVTRLNARRAFIETSIEPLIFPDRRFNPTEFVTFTRKGPRIKRRKINR